MAMRGTTSTLCAGTRPPGDDSAEGGKKHQNRPCPHKCRPANGISSKAGGGHYSEQALAMDTVYNTEETEKALSELYGFLAHDDFARSLPVREALEDACALISTDDLGMGEFMLAHGVMNNLKRGRPDRIGFWRYEREALLTPLGAGEFAAHFDEAGGSYDPCCGREFLALAVCILLSDRREWGGDGTRILGSRDFKPAVFAWVSIALGIARKGPRKAYAELYENAVRRSRDAAEESIKKSPLTLEALRIKLRSALSQWNAAQTCHKSGDFIRALYACCPFLEGLQEKDALDEWLKEPRNMRRALKSFRRAFEIATGRLRPRDASYSTNVRDYQSPLIWATLLPKFDRLGLLGLKGVPWPSPGEGLNIHLHMESGHTFFTLGDHILDEETVRGLYEAYNGIEYIVKASKSKHPAIASESDYLDRFGILFDTYRALSK